jgi:hypothetical protein
VFDNITGSVVLRIILIAVGMIFVGAVGGMIGGMYVYKLFVKPVKRSIESMSALMIATHRIRPTSALPTRAADVSPDTNSASRRVVVREEQRHVTTRTRIERQQSPMMQPQTQPQTQAHAQAQAHSYPTVITTSRKPPYRTPHPLAISARDEDTDVRIRPAVAGATTSGGVPVVPGALDTENSPGTHVVSTRRTISPSHTLPPGSR